MNTEKIEKLKKGLTNSQIPETLKQKIREQIARLESEMKSDESMTATEVKKEVAKIEEKVEDQIEIVEKKQEEKEIAKKTTVRKPRVSKPVAKKTTVRKPSQTAKQKPTAMTLAKEIRKDGESWSNARARASKMMKEKTTSTTKDVESELDKLIKLVRGEKNKAKLTGLSGTNVKRDASRKAKPRGLRTVTNSGETSNQYGTFNNKLGRKYYENRDRHSDRLAPKYPKNSPYLAEGGLTDLTMQNVSFAEGGRVGENVDLAGYSMVAMFDTLVEAKTFTDNKRKIEPEFDFVVIDDKRTSRNFIVFARLKEGRYIENRVYARGGGLRTVNGREYPLGRNWTNDHNQINKDEDHEVKYTRKKKFEIGGTVVSDLAGHTGGGDGGLNAGMPLSGFSNTGYTGLVGETGAMSSGEMFMNGGGLPSGVSQPYMITESLGNPAQHYAGGGGVKFDRYNGKTEKIISELKKLKGGLDNKAPYVYQRDGLIYVSAEEGDNYADYDNYLYIDEKLEDFADKYDTYWDWENAGAIVLFPLSYEDDFARGGGLRTVNGREYPLGRNWTNDHNQINKSEDHEVKYTRKRFDGGGEMRNKNIRTRRTKDQIRKDNYNKDVDAYNFYVVNLETKRAETGFEFREDAVDVLNDYDDNKKYKVVSKRALKTMGIENPNESFKYEFGGDFQSGVYAQGGSLVSHGLEIGDTLVRTISGGIQKIKDRNGMIVYVNLATGERDKQPPLPFMAGGLYEYKNTIEEDIDLTDDKVLRVRKPAMPDTDISEEEFMARTNMSMEARVYPSKKKME